MEMARDRTEADATSPVHWPCECEVQPQGLGVTVLCSISFPHTQSEVLPPLAAGFSLIWEPLTPTLFTCFPGPHSAHSAQSGESQRWIVGSGNCNQWTGFRSGGFYGPAQPVSSLSVAGDEVAQSLQCSLYSVAGLEDFGIENKARSCKDIPLCASTCSIQSNSKAICERAVEPTYNAVVFTECGEHALGDPPRLRVLATLMTPLYGRLCCQPTPVTACGVAWDRPAAPGCRGHPQEPTGGLQEFAWPEMLCIYCQALFDCLPLL
ncbi:hypothetical protein EGW08_003465 [Elysia chlorotica]|uniref:Uncharacterized protein n=1 Tax=Elysia chlorotica TaxID=188477 RepID=A0A3S0ZWZ0_ELYCH|nr:hypothetical protein EGW08_003465 [Elysia chlorotica]